MDINAVFVKTKKGHAALAKRGRTLNTHERYLLVLMDGERTVGDMIDQLNFMTHKDIIQSISSLKEKEYIADSGSDLGKDGSSGNLSYNAKKIIEEEMIDILGPMAALICDEVWEKTDNLTTAIDLLKSEISNHDQMMQFLLNIKDRLS